jgi:hypothetical protein
MDEKSCFNCSNRRITEAPGMIGTTCSLLGTCFNNSHWLPSGYNTINHPSHYTFGKYEVIDVIEDWKLSYHLGNVIKHIARSSHKGKQIEDLEKAAWYLKRQIDKLKKGK